MNNDNNDTDGNNENNLEAPVNKTSSLNNMNALSQNLLPQHILFLRLYF